MKDLDGGAVTGLDHKVVAPTVSLLEIWRIVNDRPTSPRTLRSLPRKHEQLGMHIKNRRRQKTEPRSWYSPTLESSTE